MIGLRSRSLVLISSVSIATALAAGCGSSVSDTGAAGPGVGGSTSSTTSSASTTGTTNSASTTSNSAITSTSTQSSTSEASSSSTGTGGGGNTFADATPLQFGSTTNGMLPTGATQYFSFQGKKGEPIYASVLAENLGGVEFDPTYIDAVLTLFDSTQTQIAQNNNQIPQNTQDPRLLTILPADGTYYLQLSECWTVIENPAAYCIGTMDKAHTAYTLYFRELDPLNDGNTVADTEKGNDAASAEPLEFLKNASTGYYDYTFVYGTFADAADIDVYSFTIPNDVLMNGRIAGELWLYPPNVNGDGSTTSIGNVWMTTAADPNTTIAQIDGTLNEGIGPPLAVGTPYLVFIQHPATPAGAQDFYFTEYYMGPIDVAEAMDVANDTPAGAEPIKSQAGQDAAPSYYMEGDIIPAGTDLDHYLLNLPPNLPAGATLAAGCTAQRRGSGLRGVKVSLLEANGTPIAGASDVETETHYAYVSKIPVPAGATSILLKAEAASQDATVKSTFYRCYAIVTP